jgi:hypothetical protein
MDILINELSLTGQFDSAEQFVGNALLPLGSVLKEIDTDSNTVYKKQDLWNYHVTSKVTLHNVLVQRTDEARRLKSLMSSLLNDPYWESSQKHTPDNDYSYKGKNIYGYSLAETCERDRIAISFASAKFSDTSLTVLKNRQPVEIDNLLSKGDYIEMAWRRKTISYKKYFDWKFTTGQCILLDNEECYRKTGRIRQGQQVYLEIVTGYSWYLDNLHKKHYEVFDSNEMHIGTANLNGEINHSTRIHGREL